MASERSVSESFGLAVSPHDLARSHLELPLPRRWAHSQGVGRQALKLGPVLDTPALLAAAAILHDIGYAPDLVDTGFHPVDGARYLRRMGADERVVSLVAHHSCAAIEADERQLSDALAVFDVGPPPDTDALIYCDMTTSPDGELVTIDERLGEILERYGADSIVGRFIQRAQPELRAATERVRDRLAAAGDQPR